MRFLPLLCSVLILISATAQAGGRATVARGDGSDVTTLEFDGNALRLSSHQLGGAQLLLRDGQAYLLNGAQAVVVTSTLTALLGRASQTPLERYTGMDNTGRNEIVARLPGSLHVLHFVDTHGRPRQAEVVLSNAPIVRELTRAIEGAAQTFAAQHARTPLFDYAGHLAEALAGRGVLRYGSDYQVLDITPEDFPRDYFSVPPLAQIPGLEQAAPLLGNLLRGLPQR